MTEKGPTYSFLVEWYDPFATIIKKFILVYHVGIKSVEMHDEKLHRIFLKPTKVEDLKLSHLYLGSSVTIFARTLRIVDFADNFTRKALGESSERCVAFIRPSSVCKAGEIIASLELSSFQLVNLKMVCPSSHELRKLMEHIKEPSSVAHLVGDLADKVFVALELMCNKACSRIVEFVGEGKAGSEADYVTNSDLCVIVQGPETAACTAERIFGDLTGPDFRGVPRLKNTTLAVIKPHAVAEGLTGRIWAAIQARGFCVTAAGLYRLSKTDAAEFLEVYKGVAHEYPEMLDQMTSGPCVALEIATSEASGDTQQAFREFVGPVDPDIARFLRPETLRAQFGVDKVQNAIHCTDLPDDAELEVNFFFRVLAK